MNAAKKILAVYTILVICFSAYVFANQLTTTMTWYVPSLKSHSVGYGGACNGSRFFFPEGNAVFDSDTDGNCSGILPYSVRNGSGDTNCQGPGTAAMTITNSGNSTVNIDANFASMDANLWLKVWLGQGDGGCGTSPVMGPGFGPWTLDCNVVATTSPVTPSACKDFNAGNATTASRIASSLVALSSQKVCFSGEMRDANSYLFSASLTTGDHNADFRTSVDVS